jgi:hypothetical protein
MQHCNREGVDVTGSSRVYCSAGFFLNKFSSFTLWHLYLCRIGRRNVGLFKADNESVKNLSKSALTAFLGTGK